MTKKQNKTLVTKYKQEAQKHKILEAITDGHTYNQIALNLGVTRQYVQTVLQEELASATTPQKIVELRDHQNQTLTSHTPTLHKRFNQQTKITERLIKKYEQYLDEEDQGLYSYTFLYQQNLIHNTEENNEAPEEKQLTLEQLKKQTHTDTIQEIAQYKQNREQTARELERTTKLGNDNYQILLKHNERLAKLNGLDTPVAQQLLIHRTDEIKVNLQNDILRTQQELEAKNQPIIEAEIVTDG